MLYFFVVQIPVFFSIYYVCSLILKCMLLGGTLGYASIFVFEFVFSSMRSVAVIVCVEILKIPSIFP